MKTILATALLLATAALTHAKVLVDLDFQGTNDFTKSITVTSENPQDYFRAKNGVE